MSSGEVPDASSGGEGKIILLFGERRKDAYQKWGVRKSEGARQMMRRGEVVKDLQKARSPQSSGWGYHEYECWHVPAVALQASLSMHAPKDFWRCSARASLSMRSGSGRKAPPRRVHEQLTVEVAAASDEAVVRAPIPCAGGVR